MFDIFYQLFGFPKDNSGPLQRKHPHLPDVNHYPISKFGLRSSEPHKEVGSQSPVERIGEIQSRNYLVPVPHPDIFWTYHFLKGNKWMVDVWFKGKKIDIRCI